MSKETKKQEAKAVRAAKKAEAREQRRNIYRTIRFMLRTTVKEKPMLFVVYVINIVSAIIQKFLEILVPKFLIDELMLIINGAPAAEHIKTIVTLVVIINVLGLTFNLIGGLGNQTKNVIREYFNEHFQLLLSEKAMRMDFECTEDPDVLNKMNRAKEGISWYSGGVVGILDAVMWIVSYVLVLLGVSAIILITCPLLLPLQLISLLVIGYFNARNNATEAMAYGRLSKLNRVFSYYLFELPDFRYGKEIRLYDASEMMNERAKTLSLEQTQVWRDLAVTQRKFNWGMDITNALRDGCSYFYIGLLALKQIISVGDFAMCVASASELYQGMNGLVVNVQEVVKRCNYAYHFLEFLDYPEPLVKGTESVKEGEHVIEFSHVTFRYPRSEENVLEDVNLTIRSGEHLSVVGMNGAGKTTFIKLLCRLYDVTEGEIRIDGVNIKDYSDEEYRRLFSVVFQDFKLLAFSLRENITFGKDEQDEKLMRTLELAGLGEDVKKLDNGLETLLFKGFDEKGTELSGGQQQKVAISRALYKDAPIVVLDEPTAALDPIAEYEIYRQFDTLVGGKTAIYISHRLSSCKFCDRIAVFADHTIKEYGTHAELVNRKDGIYAEMFAAQAQYYVEQA